MISIEPRQVAAQALMDVTANGAYNNMALKRILKQNGAMPQRDKGFVTEVVNGTLRNLLYIDARIEQVSSTKCQKMKPWVLAVLRTAVYQIVFMNVPQSAAVDEAVKLVKQRGLSSLSGFVNAVLRALIRQSEDSFLPDKTQYPAEYLSLRYSHPLWVIKMWLSQYDFSFVEELCKKDNTAPSVTITANRLKTTKETLLSILEKEGVLAKEGRLECIKLLKTPDIASLKSFQEGLFHVQDESSALAVEILDPKPGESILDLCAAPGGKSFFAAEKMKQEGTLIARDIHPHKTQLIEESAARLGLSMIQTQVFDAAQYCACDKGRFDRVLVDAAVFWFGPFQKKAGYTFA